MANEVSYFARFDVEGTFSVNHRPVAFPVTFSHRVLVTGGRCYSDRQGLFETLSAYAAENPISELAAGCATGADDYALQWAERSNVACRQYRADWMRYGDSAGSRRNIAMLDDFQPDIVIAFPGNIGTTHCLRHARKRGIPRKIIDHGGDWFEEIVRWG